MSVSGLICFSISFSMTFGFFLVTIHTSSLKNCLFTLSFTLFNVYVYICISIIFPKVELSEEARGGKREGEKNRQ
jgi:hypothetical protein